MSRFIILSFFMIFLVIIPSCVYSKNFESENPCLLINLKQNVQIYYNAVNAENREAMYFFESEEYQHKHPLANYEPQLLEMKKVGRFVKLSVKSIELTKIDMATVVIDLLIFNKIEEIWYTDGSFFQLWKCKWGKWFVDSPPRVILLK